MLVSAIKWIISVLAIPFVAAYKAIKAGIIHIFNEVDRLFLFNSFKKEILMATLASLDAKLDTVLIAIANISSGDNSAVLAAIQDLKTDMDTNVEGLTPEPAPAE